MRNCKMVDNGQMVFEEVFDPFPTEDVFSEDDLCLDDSYKKLSKELFGETEEKMADLIRDLKDATQKKGIEIPGNRSIQRSAKRRG